MIATVFMEKSRSASDVCLFDVCFVFIVLDVTWTTKQIDMWFIYLTLLCRVSEYLLT